MVPAQIELRRSNFRPGFFSAVVSKFEPNMTVLIKNLAQKVDFSAKCRSNQDVIKTAVVFAPVRYCILIFNSL